MNPNRPTIIAGNWKMNGSRAANAALLDGIGQAWSALAHQAPSCQVLVCAPTVYLSQISEHIQSSVQIKSTSIAIHLGAQDVSTQSSGAYTGECAAGMLKEAGCSHVIVGHSERRQYHGETDTTVAAKAKAALAQGLQPIVCVGETLAQRDAGQAITVVSAQLKAVTDLLQTDAARIAVAYEPVWAIGTGRTASPEQAQEIHAALRNALTSARAAGVPILYGGSMNAANAQALLSQPDIDGGLIGGASLKPADFTQIISAAHALRAGPH